MARRKRHNPERRAWKGRSYKHAKGGSRRIVDLKIDAFEVVTAESYEPLSPEEELLLEQAISEPFPF